MTTNPPEISRDPVALEAAVQASLQRMKAACQELKEMAGLHQGQRKSLEGLEAELIHPSSSFLAAMKKIETMEQRGLKIQPMNGQSDSLVAHYGLGNKPNP